MSVLGSLARRYTSRGLRQALRTVAAEAAINRQHRRGLRAARQFAGARNLQIQLGSGGQPKPGWVNVDLFADADVHLDLREPLPFADDSARIVYAEHVLPSTSFTQTRCTASFARSGACWRRAARSSWWFPMPVAP